MVWLRRGAQVFFLGLFFFLFLQATFHPGPPEGEDHPGTGVQFFFNIDPLVLVSTWLAVHRVLSGMLWAMVTIVVTLLMGRFFCGWLCPLGVLHNALSSLRRKTPAWRVRTGVWSPCQRSKYYVLVVVLIAALLGVQLAGVLDPASLLYRSTATVIYPAFCRATEIGFNFLYHKDPRLGPLRATAVSEPIYSFLRKSVLPTYTIYFTGGVLIGLLFFVILLLNVHRIRFWCRYVCPLGALLGLFSRFTVFRVKNDPAVCTRCNLCAASCPSGADPHLPTGWHRSECFFCWNCKQVCPVDAIRLGFEIPSARVASDAPTGPHGKPAKETGS